MNIGGHTRPQILPKLLFWASVQELHNILFSDLVYDGLKEERYVDNNNIISDSTLR